MKDVDNVRRCDQNFNDQAKLAPTRSEGVRTAGIEVRELFREPPRELLMPEQYTAHPLHGIHDSYMRFTVRCHGIHGVRPRQRSAPLSLPPADALSMWPPQHQSLPVSLTRPR